MIKPEFFDDPAVADVSPLARLFFVGLWTQADREGRLPDDIRRLKARLFPFDAVDAEALAVELHGQDMIRRYSGSDGKAYIWIRNFVKHQRPHPKEPASVIPACENGDGKRNGTPCLNPAKPSESGVLILDSGTRKLDSGKRKLEHGAKNAAKPNGVINGRSGRPIFQGQRFVVFEWMFEDLARMLGPHTNDFGLDLWFWELDAKAEKAKIVKAKNDWWPWIQAELLAEAKHRGLPVETPAAFGITKKTAGNAAALQRFVEKHQ